MRQAGQGGWRARVFAWGMARGLRSYEPWVAERKRKLFGGLSGEVLEIGPGSGVNLAYLPREVRWTGVEPNPYFHPYIQREADRLARPIRLRVGLAEKLGAEDESLDAVIGTLVLCSVDEVRPVLSEILRVLKPAGRYYFLEHVAGPGGSRLCHLQHLLRPVWCRILDGCRPDRETLHWITEAGFCRLQCEQFRVPLPVVSPHICGFAEKAG